MQQYAKLSYKVSGSGTATLKVALTSGFSKSWAEYVTKLVTHMYSDNVDQMCAVRDALSPFQIISKTWVADSLAKFGQNRPSYFFIGSWFGQQAQLMQETMPSDFHLAQKYFVDKDARATYIASDVCSTLANTAFFPEDVFDTSAQPPPSSVVVWTGLEHFDPKKVADYIESKKHQGLLWCLQGTDMPDDDHINPIRSVNDLTRYFHSDNVLYSGELITPLGTRYMVITLN